MSNALQVNHLHDIFRIFIQQSNIVIAANTYSLLQQVKIPTVTVLFYWKDASIAKKIKANLEIV